jgi:Ca-activated chloride channel family protein
MKRLFIVIIALSLISPLVVKAQEKTSSPIIFIYDASGSMWGQLQDTTKMEIAAEVLSGSINTLVENQQVGLLAYGHREKGNCRDVEFLVKMENTDKDLVNSSLADIKPLGKTPLAYSATQVINRLREADKKATIILITGGIESCDGNICDVVTAARAEGIDFRLHIVGFGLQGEETAQLK